MLYLLSLACIWSGSIPFLIKKVVDKITKQKQNIVGTESVNIKSSVALKLDLYDKNNLQIN